MSPLGVFWSGRSTRPFRLARSLRTTLTTRPIPVAWSSVAPGAVGQFTPSVLTRQRKTGPSSSPSTNLTRIVGLTFAGGLRHEMYHLP